MARDVTGLQGQALTVSKIHLFAYAIIMGIYQTRATFLLWARAVHEATWEMELPTVAYVIPDDNIFEIVSLISHSMHTVFVSLTWPQMVNNIASLRSRVKERVRIFVEKDARFKQSMNNPDTIRENLEKFNLLYPNTFHCKVSP